MAISVFPAPVTSSLNASAITATSANTLYEGRTTFDPGVYTISCASATATNFEFYSNSTTLVTSGVTASGTVLINLASTADRIRLWTNTGSSIVVTITKTAAALTNAFSGTLDTISASGTYNQTGPAYVLVVGGGAGGNANTGSQNVSYRGGAGGVCGAFLTLSGSTSVTVGNGGAAGANGNATTFGSLTANGGSGSTGGNGTGGNNSSSNLTTAGYPFVVASVGSYGAAGAIWNSDPSGDGTAGGNATVGFGGGGGAGGYNAYNGTRAFVGGAGRQGGVYVLRGL